MTDEWDIDAQDEDFISKSQIKREVMAVTDLGAKLVGLTKKQLNHLPLDPDILELIIKTQSLPQGSARKREIQYLGKQLRAENIEEIQAAYDELINPKVIRSTSDSTLSRGEKMLTLLMEDTKAGLSSLIEQAPQADVQRIRNWLRQLGKSTDDKKINKLRRSIIDYLNTLFD